MFDLFLTQVLSQNLVDHVGDVWSFAFVSSGTQTDKLLYLRIVVFF